MQSCSVQVNLDYYQMSAVSMHTCPPLEDEHHL